jgi:hypothetical protein
VRTKENREAKDRQPQLCLVIWPPGAVVYLAPGKIHETSTDHSVYGVYSITQDTSDWFEGAVKYHSSANGRQSRMLRHNRIIAIVISHNMDGH